MPMIVVQEGRIKENRLRLQTPIILVSTFHKFNFGLIGDALNNLSD